MARLVAAFGSSHSIMLTATLEDWQSRFRQRDPGLELYDRAGNRFSFDEAVKAAPADAGELIAPARIAERHEQAHAAIAKLRDDILSAALDALIIVGDDQYELFQDDHMPSIALYYGDTIRNGGPEPVPAADWFGQARQGYHEPKIEATYPCAGALARHLIAGLVAREFDISTLDRLPDGHSEGHAYGFVHRHYLAGTRVPILPVFLNTYYPPNQPTPRRCVALGRAIADLVASYPEDSRIGILGSGGLSHFLIDASLDRSIIDAFGRKDLEFLAGLDPRRLQSGSSEIRNWLVMAAAAQALDLAWVSYIPGYRSAALTGTGLCFARWR